MFEIDGWEAAVRYPTREAIEKAKSLIEVGPLAMRRGPGGEVLIFCGTEETVPGVPGTLVALIRPDGVGKA